MGLARTARRVVGIAAVVLACLAGALLVAQLVHDDVVPTAGPAPTSTPTATPTNTMATPSATPTIDGVKPPPQHDPPHPGPPLPQTGGPGAPTLAQYRRSCQRAAGPEKWRAGQVDYPKTLAATLDEGVVYEAAVDINDKPLPPQKVITGDATAKKVLVQCIVSARLVSVDGSMVITSLSTDVGGWYPQDFSPTGLASWTWTVTGTEPGHHDLRLVVRPATSVDDLLRGVPSGEQSFTTRAEVEAGSARRLVHWADEQLGPVKTFLATVGLGLLGFFSFIGGVGEQWDKLRGRKRRDSP